MTSLTCLLCLLIVSASFHSFCSDLKSSDVDHIDISSHKTISEVPKIIVIQNHQRQYYSKMLEQMYARRHDVFIKRLMWNIPIASHVRFNHEIDQYDGPDAVYLLHNDSKNGVNGDARLLPITGPYMLKNTFAHLMDDPSLIPSSPDIWESSRFFFNKPKTKKNSLDFTRKGTAKILMSMQEFGLSWGLKQIVAVTDLRVEKITKKLDWDFKRITTPKTIQGGTVVVLIYDISEQNLMRMRQKSGIFQPVSSIPLPFIINQTETPLSLCKNVQARSKL